MVVIVVSSGCISKPIEGIWVRMHDDDPMAYVCEIRADSVVYFYSAKGTEGPFVVKKLSDMPDFKSPWKKPKTSYAILNLNTPFTEIIYPCHGFEPLNTMALTAQLTVSFDYYCRTSASPDIIRFIDKAKLSVYKK